MYKNILTGCVVFLIFSIFLHSALPTGTHIYHQDSQGYLALAKTIHEFGVHALQDLPPVAVGYPYCLSRLLYLPGSLEVLVFISQLFLALATLVFIYLLVDELLGSSGANWALFFASINIGFLTYVHCCLTEICLTFFYAAFMYLMVKFFKNKTPLKALFAGGVLGLSIWIKPAAWLFGWHLIFIACLLGVCIQDKIFKYAVWFSLGFLSLSFANLLFNYYLFGFLAFPPLMYTNLYYLYLPKILSATRGISYPNALQMVHQICAHEQLTMLLQTLYDYPWIACSIWIQNMLKTVLGLCGANLALLVEGVFQSKVSYFLLSGSFWERIYAYCWNEKISVFWNLLTCFDAVYMSVRLLLFIPGGVFLCKNLTREVIYFLISFLGYFIAITGADGCARLRMMTEPVFILVMAAGIIFFLRDTPARC